LPAANFVKAVLERNPGTRIIRVAKSSHGNWPLVVRLANSEWRTNKSNITRHLKIIGRGEFAKRLLNKRIVVNLSFNGPDLELSFSPKQRCEGSKCGTCENEVIAEQHLPKEQQKIEALKNGFDEMDRLAGKPETLQKELDAALKKMTEGK
jgi:hypothetical protein